MKKILTLAKTSILLVAFMLCTVLTWADDPVKESPDKPVNILEGHIAAKKRVVSGYKIVKYGFIGGEFSKIVPVYKSVDCCKYTGNLIDGCSAPIKCNG